MSRNRHSINKYSKKVQEYSPFAKEIVKMVNELEESGLDNLQDLKGIMTCDSQGSLILTANNEDLSPKKSNFFLLDYLLTRLVTHITPSEVDTVKALVMKKKSRRSTNEGYRMTYTIKVDDLEKALILLTLR